MAERRSRVFLGPSRNISYATSVSHVSDDVREGGIKERMNNTIKHFFKGGLLFFFFLKNGTHSRKHIEEEGEKMTKIDS